MITTTEKRNDKFFINFAWEKDPEIRTLKIGLEDVFNGAYLETMYVPLYKQACIYIGCGKREEVDLLAVKEIFATIAAKCKVYKIKECSMDVSRFLTVFGSEAVVQIVLGLTLGSYSYSFLKEKEDQWQCTYQLENTEVVGTKEEINAYIKEGEALSQGILFARDMTNTPGNHLRPMDFERAIQDYVKDCAIEVETMVYGQLRAMGLEALYGVGGSSEYPPCLMILRYKGNSKSKDVYGLIGKGVTCDTGGYCLKGAKSMTGIKGDMAGAAAVVGAMRAIATQKLCVNVTACLPLCENRISPSSHLPGDVITSYSGKTIEILNTDAEGRLILADAISYGLKNEGITKVLDIATLTGAAWSTLGYTIAGAMADDENFYNLFENGLNNAAERYLRFPFYKEHEKMIQSDVADVKNIGGDCCGIITAGLFIRSFCEGKPWIHLDIAGTAWCQQPNFAFESKGATGAGVTSIYYMIKGAQK